MEIVHSSKIEISDSEEQIRKRVFLIGNLTEPLNRPERIERCREIPVGQTAMSSNRIAVQKCRCGHWRHAI